MKTIEELLTNLARPEVLEFGLVTNRLPSVNIGGKFEPVDDEAPTSERVLQMLVTMGGSRYVETLSDKPVQWTTRLDGVGVVAVAAIMRQDIVQARFTVAKREVAPSRPPALQSLPAGAAERATAAVSPQRTQSTPAVAKVAPPIQPQVIKSVGATPSSTMGRVQPASNASAPVGPAVAPAARRMPRGAWDDDDEPTLQTVLPPVPAGAGSAESRGATERAAAERASQEKVAREEAAAERAQRERTAQEQRSAQERAARERASAEAQPVTSPRATMPRRIATPTSVDVVEVRPPKDRSSDTLSITINFDSDEVPTVEPRAVVAARPRGASPTDAPASPPAPIDGPRPRVDPSASLDWFLALAVTARASDLHLVAGRPLLLRVASELVPRTEPVPAEHVERITKDIVPSRLHESLEREGGCDFAIEHPTHGRFRVNVTRQRTGYKLSLRVISREIPTLATLGLPDAVASALRWQRGLVLVTGQRGQGKSCTLAALVDHLNRETGRHVMTIEEPIEHVHPKKRGLVSQRDAGLHSPTRARAFETALRDDVDILVIGELRDVACARHALAACDGGRLVLCAMNAPRAAKAIDRFVDLFPTVEQGAARSSLASSLRMIVGQRLVPSSDRTRLHAAVEVLPWSVALHGLVRDGRTEAIPELQTRSRSAENIRLDESLAELVLAQKVTLEAAMAVAEVPAELEARLSRGASLARKV